MKKAFSLVEIMIAVAILGVALIPMINMLGMGTRGFAKTQNTIQSYNLAVEGLEWMKSLDFNYNYYQTQNTGEDGFWILSHKSFNATETVDGQDPQQIMYVYNKNKHSDAEKDPLKYKRLSDFKAWYVYGHGSKDAKKQEVIISYKQDFYRKKEMSEFQRFGYFELIEPNMAKVTCVVTWHEGRFLTGNNERIEKISTVVVNNANVRY
ncbi:MAG: prepilin-type N-terminal cleavage/methylation domain-containing protein [Candidatus Muirbacterium halophilum]|nr:prepilin-type N-terminal cleavage/methylation domain-containing protein [Candidatus Muirbacterium halophilum]MCK9475193.1 prepilin-type N-terminal cleavage/methylation domain-containing protein [Candidatus Muirbacterium halophilum]